MLKYVPTVGVRVEKRSGKKHGIKLTPYGDFYVKVDQDGDEIVKSLGSYGIHANNRGKFVKVQGIKNCEALSSIIDNAWFAEVMSIFSAENHNELEGILDIIDLIEQKHTIANKQELMTIIMS